jgi:hypothetical protein
MAQQSATSPFIVNILPLANINSNTSGTNQVTQLAAAVGNLQQMVNFEQKRINADTISAYTSDGSVNFISPINLCNVGITTDGIQAQLTVGTLTAGTVYASNYVTLSDRAVKRNVREVSTGSVLEGLSGVRTYAFQMMDAGSGGTGDPVSEDQMEIGLLAQEVEAAFPQCVTVGPGGRRYVKYDSVVALLLGAVRSLGERVAVLEERGESQL